MAILSLDQSTSATKAVLFDEKGRVLAKATREHRQIYPQPGWVEHDAEEIWQNVQTVVGEIAACQADIDALSLTNQRETILVFERATGKPLHHAMVWQCGRGESICRSLREAGHDTSVRRKTGLPIDTYFSASKIRWLMEKRPDIAAKLHSGEAVIGTIDTFLLHRLTNGEVFATDFTNASRTLLFDISTLRWDAELCGLFHVPMRALPEVRESSAIFGTTTITGKEIPLTGVMGDSQASLFAQRCFDPGCAKATFGTGTSVMLNVGEKFLLAPRGAVTALAWVRQQNPIYAWEGLINFSAATISWLKNQLGLIREEDDVEQIVRSVPDNGGVYLVPAFAGLGAPHWSASARAAIHGMTAHTTKAHVVRAGLESISYQIRDVLDMIRTGTGVELRSLQSDGGPTKNRFLMQFTADITGAEIIVSEVAESSAWGAAMNGLLGLGLREVSDLRHAARETTTYRPQRDPVLVTQWHEGWTNAVRRVL